MCFSYIFYKILAEEWLQEGLEPHRLAKIELEPIG